MNNDFLILPLPDECRVKVSNIEGYFLHKEIQLGMIFSSGTIYITFDNKEERDNYLKNLDKLFNTTSIQCLISRYEFKAK